MASDPKEALIVIAVDEAGQASPTGIGGKLVMKKGLAEAIGLDSIGIPQTDVVRQVPVLGHTRVRQAYPGAPTTTYNVRPYPRTAGAVRSLLAGENWELQHANSKWYGFRSLGCRAYDIIKFFEGQATDVTAIRSPENDVYAVKVQPDTLAGAAGNDTLPAA